MKIITNPTTACTIVLMIGFYKNIKAQSLPFELLSNRTIICKTHVEKTVEVSQNGQEGTDVLEQAAGSKSTRERTRQISLSKTPKGTQVTLTWLQLVWGDFGARPSYDSKNAFERNDFGDQMGAQWDKFMNKPARLLYKPNAALPDTLLKPKDFFNRWRTYESIDLTANNSIWNEVFLVSAIGKPLTKGYQWKDSVTNDDASYIDMYTVLDLTGDKVIIALQRTGKPRNNPLPANGSIPKAPGIYWGNTKSTAKITLDRSTSLIERMEIKDEVKRIEVKKKSSIDIRSTINSIVTNK